MGRRKEHMDVELADAIYGDLPDGAYWAIMEETTGMDPADMFYVNHSKNARKKLASLPHKTTPKPQKQLRAFGELRQCNAYHWQLKGAFGKLDWWPHKGKWSLNAQRAEAGDFKKMLAIVEAEAAAIAAALKSGSAL